MIIILLMDYVRQIIYLYHSYAVVVWLAYQLTFLNCINWKCPYETRREEKRVLECDLSAIFHSIKMGTNLDDNTRFIYNF